jgi:hypothetical protein
VPPIRFISTALAVLMLAACGGSDSPAGADAQYPVVTDPPPEWGETITQPSGATVSRPLKPANYQTEPSPTCERQPYKSASGGGLIVVPPRPGLEARAVSARTVELKWWFEDVPSDCRPETMLVSIVANDAPSATPTTVVVPFTGSTGSATVSYPDFLPPPDVALASAVMARGERSRTARVLVRR